MKTKVYIDCGFYRGIAMMSLFKDGVIDETWQVYAFEPNKRLEVKKTLKSYPLPIKLIEKAVWTKNTKIDFKITTRENASTAYEHLHPSNILETITVPAINFSLFLKKLPNNAYIYCSMDIEGAEYEVLEKLLQDGTIDRIKVLNIEFHHRMMTDREEQDSADLIKRIKARGIKVILKVPLH